jgi:hypothetical protein
MGLLCFIFPGLAIAVWIGGMLIRAAVWLANAAIGGASPSEAGYYEPRGYAVDWQGRPQPHRAVPMPPLGKAMAIAFAVGVANFLSIVALGLMFGAASAAGITPAIQSRLAASPADQVRGLIAIAVSFLVQAGMLSLLLPTSFGRACLVQVLNWAVYFLIVAAAMTAIFSLHVVRHH